MDLSRDWLMETAGWKAVKEGRNLHQAGGVSDARITDSLVRGKVKIGRRVQVAGLKIHSSTDVDNLCRCPESLRNGTICAHSVAVALAADEQRTLLAQQEQEGADGKKSENSGNEEVQLGFISIILEAVFVELWSKDRFPVRLREVEKGAEGAVPPDSGQSNQIRAWLEENCRIPANSLPPFLVLNRKQAGALLKLCAGYPFFRIDGDEQEAMISTQSIRLKIKLGLADEKSGFRLTLSGFEGGDQVLLQQADIDEAPWIYSRTRKQWWPVRLPESSADRKLLHQLLQSDENGVLISEVMLANALADWSDVFDLETDPEIQLPSLSQARPEFELRMEGSLNHISASIHAFYGKHEITLGKSGDDSLEDVFPYQERDRTSENENNRYFTRNIQAEKTALHELTGAGFDTPNQQGELHLRGRREVMSFHVSVVPRLRNKWKAVHFGERYREIAPRIKAVRPVVEFSDSPPGEDWFSCSFQFDSSDGCSPLSENEVRRLLATGQNQVKKSDGDKLCVLDQEACEDWFEVLRDCDVQQEAGKFRIPNSQRGFVEASLSQYQQGPQLLDNRKESLDTEKLLEKLGDLPEILRPYQRDGILWLYQKLLPENGGGALLADEMGLGKTLQTLAVSKLLKSRDSGSNDSSPILVVCPTSLIDNWAAECQKFVPEYKVLPMRGAKRSDHFKNLCFADLVITSYALLIRDIDRYADQHFRLVVLDEASYIRNPKTRNARSVKKLNADSRLALTGTPVENSVLDIWAISDFVQPGYLGAREEFKERYEKPINSGKASVQVHQRFRRRLDPIILRRTKRKVAKDLPDKLEKILYCTLNNTQKAYYDGILREMRNKISRAISSGDERGARMNMLTALLRLRQICCDSRLLESTNDEKSLDKRKNSAKQSESAKMELLRQLLQESVEGGHRVLIFSQFVSMLKLIREELLESGLCGDEIAYLDGSSQDRAAQVERFQTDSTISLFLISLKAGGYGLNLTGADTVIHFDPWWNPAVEAQATDRAHRIGQEKIVTSYKLIARDTVEEKILKLQQRKRDIFDAAIDDETPMMRGLDTDDLREILEV
ncbi:MAG: DEAD/DEAH box helicase [Verrucomicrobia bacterium]|nr:DEAD/DEAH box helicase [Verrucomicrobiota bacterium]